jgi:hypothetical protein
LPRLGEGDALDPVDRIDLRVARVAELLDPFGDASAAGVVGGEGIKAGAVIAADQIAQMRLPSCVVGGTIAAGAELDL